MLAVAEPTPCQISQLPPVMHHLLPHHRHFCNPKYDPNIPLPARILPPHAPPTAAEVDDWRVFNASIGRKLTRPGKGDKAREEFVRYLKLRDVDWRDAFHRGLADHVAEFKREKRLEAERQRQAAWKEYRDGLFAKAIASPGLKTNST